MTGAGDVPEVGPGGPRRVGGGWDRAHGTAAAAAAAAAALAWRGGGGARMEGCGAAGVRPLSWTGPAAAHSGGGEEVEGGRRRVTWPGGTGKGLTALVGPF